MQEIIELHHNQKKDAPSGTAVKTALMMSEVNDNFTLFDLTEIAYNLEEKLNKKVDIITSGNLDELLYEEDDE